VVSSICVVTIFSIFVLAAAKIARELKAGIVVFWFVPHPSGVAEG